ncbi:DEAD/DEAH box helicase [bacterium]|nr:DEAD/DEAH box helicase [bacterium]
MRDLRAWTQGADTGGSFRLCCRVEPPEDTEKANSAEWRVSYHLQALDDPSVVLDAADVWTTSKRTLTFLKRKWEDPQERLLAHLGKASRLSPAIEKSLSDPTPTGFFFSAGDAYDFLRHAAPLLEQAGLGVLTPPWWSKPVARLGVKMKLSSKDGGGVSSGLVGEEGIVAFSWSIALGDAELSLAEFERLARLKQPLVKVRGQWVELKADQIEAALEFFRKKQDRGEMALSDALRAGLFHETDAAGLPLVGVEVTGDIAPLFEGLTTGQALAPVSVPRSLKGTLRPYQERGLSWLAFLERFGLGACLADDMGLGKTIQLLALLLLEREGVPVDSGIPPTLLFAPMSVLENWKLEALRFAPSLRVTIHHGPQRLSTKDDFIDHAKRHDLVLSTYALALRDRELFQALSWRRVVLDEAQNIKNSQARQTRAIRAIGASRRAALTGTPVENRLAELWSIMEFLNPGFLGQAESFRRGFAIPIEKYRNTGRAEILKRAISPFVLRRLKTDRDVIADLPEKIETKVFCPLSREQGTLYQAVVNEMMEKIDSAEGIERKGLVLATLMKLKQICNHPAQFLQERDVPERSLDGRSGKLTRLLSMLEEILDAGDKALIFTQFAAMGTMLRTSLQHATGRETLFLHGAVPKKKRDAMVAEFQSPGGPALFLLSVKAGGTGLNLTSASHVFHFDRWWNPAVEDQATDRAFRIGQKKNVQVHKFVCQGTIEERIDRMIDEKKALADSVIGVGENMLTEMSTDRLREMFALSREAVAED